MLERLQKIIAAAGITSRRAAEELIAEGRVRVNGQVVTEAGSKADPAKDHIKVDGKLINPHQPPTYIMLNKPAGYVTTMSDPEGRPTVQDLLKGVKTRVYPVGRLDYNTEGLLLLTNDGDFAHLITHPKHEFPKTYLAKVKGVLEDSQIEKLEAGMFLEDGKTAPAKVRKMRKEEANSWLEITIHEGRKRQVRRMFDHVGHSVIRLKRTKTGSLVLGDLPEGSFRHLTSEEVRALRDTALKTDEGGRQVRVFKPEVRQEKPRDARTHTVQAIDEEARKRSRARVEMRETRSGMRKNQGLRKPTARPSVPFEKVGSRAKGESRPDGAGGRYGTPGQKTWQPKSAEGRTGSANAASRPDRATRTRTVTGRSDWKSGAPRKSGFGNRRAGQRTGFQDQRPASSGKQRLHFEGRREGGLTSRSDRGPETAGGTRRPSWGRPGEKPLSRSGEGFVRQESRREGPTRSGPRKSGQKPAFGSRGASRRADGSGWKPSGARPNKSRFTGGKGPGSRSGPGKGPGRGGRRNPRR
jgi:23S rRNA pseudouridine2605 synthase